MRHERANRQRSRQLSTEGAGLRVSIMTRAKEKQATPKVRVFECKEINIRFKVTVQYRFMRTRINREKTYNKQEQAPSAELIFMGLRFVSVKVLNRYIFIMNTFEKNGNSNKESMDKKRVWRCRAEKTYGISKDGK